MFHMGMDCEEYGLKKHGLTRSDCARLLRSIPQEAGGGGRVQDDSPGELARRGWTWNTYHIHTLLPPPLTRCLMTEYQSLLLRITKIHI